MKRMKQYIIILIAFVMIATFTKCEDAWEQHYGTDIETVDKCVWEQIKLNPGYSSFVEYMETYNIDSLFDSNDVYTLFVPTNDAFNNFLENNQVERNSIEYHILRYYIQPNNQFGKRKIQTLMLKFADFENSNSQYFFDNIPVTFSSPLYSNGRYFEIEKVATPKPSIYEYIEDNIPSLKKYIDELDSLVLDLELSRPIGFDDDGNTVYDSVITVINRFEEEFFPVSEEFRVMTATLAFPKQDLYNSALTEMALNLGGDYSTYEDIDEEWQFEVLIPYLLEHGVFRNMREQNEFAVDSMMNILGDSVFIFYRPEEKVLCSNGYAYNYREFTVLDSLYMSTLRFEGEKLANTIGNNRFSWHDSITVESSQTFTPRKVVNRVAPASNDTILQVDFPRDYEGQFDIEFKSPALFPRRYLVVVRTNMDYGGIYDIYVNDELVKTFDYYDFIRLRGIMPSSVSGLRFIPVQRLNKFDFWVDNITEYGRVNVRFEYKGPGEAPRKAPNQGFYIDYIDFVPEDKTHLITKNP
jgi:uncharacterized surface protein with fasciclin (FAS1) repeats